MIQSLGIENFQAHKELFLEFSPGVNVITGQSDAGKSAIIKAIRWLMTNRPSGDAFKNWDAEEDDSVGVELTLDNGSVAILREDDKTSYLLTDKPNGKTKTLSTVKTNVPLEITEKLNLPERNVQTQFEKYFLLQDSPGDVASKLNKLVGLDMIDTMYKNIDKKIRDSNTQINLAKKDRDRIEEELKGYENLEAIKKLIDSIEKNEFAASGITSRLNFLHKSISTLEDIAEKRQAQSFYLEMEESTIKLNGKINTLSALQTKLLMLSRIVKSLEEIKEIRKEDEAWLDMEPAYVNLKSKFDSLQNMENRKDKLETIFITVDNIQRARMTEMDKYKNAMEKYTNLLIKNKMCPTCGNTITEQEILNISKVISTM